MKKFEVGKEYTCRSLCDYDCIFKFTVIKRTEKTITTKEAFEKEVKRVKVSIVNEIETAYPFGMYSMAPMIKAQ